ncbi:Nuclear transport factor 2 [Aphelenchoides avenae]|nr:Nuclear transport factor 2 [Aphelenchus avenae]
MAQSQVAQTLADLQKSFDKTFDTGDAAKLAKEYYHPHAVLVQRGGKAWYGTEEITAAYTEFTKVFKADTFGTRHDKVGQSADGEYLFLQGSYWEKEKPSVVKAFEQVFKRVDGGKYLIYHDEFEA